MPDETPQPWCGSLTLLPGAVLYRGTGGDAAWHAHHAVQLMVSLDAPFELETDAPSPAPEALIVAQRAQAAVVPRGVPHRLRCRSAELVLVLLEPFGPRGRALGRIGELGAARSTELARAVQFADARGDHAGALVDRILALTGAAPPAAPPSRPVQAALEYLERGASTGNASLAEAARLAHLSPSRLTHHFSQELGIPFRRYALWVRLRTAVDAVSEGADGLAGAAAAAGFSDAAHLSRVFKRNFGLPPSSLLRMRPGRPQSSSVEAGTASTLGPWRPS